MKFQAVIFVGFEIAIKCQNQENIKSLYLLRSLVLKGLFFYLFVFGAKKEIDGAKSYRACSSSIRKITSSKFVVGILLYKNFIQKR